MLSSYYEVSDKLSNAHLFIFLLAVVPVLIYLFIPGGLADPHFFHFFHFSHFSGPWEVTYLFIFPDGFCCTYSLIFPFPHSFWEFFLNEIFK